MTKSKRCPRSKKRKYMTEGAAIHAALEMSVSKGVPFSIYTCEGTRHWHITKMRQRGST